MNKRKVPPAGKSSQAVKKRTAKAKPSQSPAGRATVRSTRVRQNAKSDGDESLLTPDRAARRARPATKRSASVQKGANNASSAGSAISLRSGTRRAATALPTTEKKVAAGKRRRDTAVEQPGRDELEEDVRPKRRMQEAKPPAEGAKPAARKACDAPNREREQRLWEKNLERIAGVDEAGRGPLAGPVVAAACVLPRDADAALLDGIRVPAAPAVAAKPEHAARHELHHDLRDSVQRAFMHACSRLHGLVGVSNRSAPGARGRTRS
jgi:hypothetical protein